METSEPPMKREFTGTFTVVPDAANPLMGTITATIASISHDGTALEEPMLAGALAIIGGEEQTFNYTLMPAADRTGITVTGDLLDKLLGLPDAMVTAERSGPPNLTLDGWNLDDRDTGSPDHGDHHLNAGDHGPRIQADGGHNAGIQLASEVPRRGRRQKCSVVRRNTLSLASSRRSRPVPMLSGSPSSHQRLVPAATDSVSFTA